MKNKDHNIEVINEGSGNMSSLQAVCSCGWKSIKNYSYNDNQMRNLRREKENHYRDIQKNKVSG